MDDVIGCNWLLTQLNGLKVEEKENYNSKFLCQNATVQCRLKKNQENNQKSQKNHRFFYRKQKQIQDQTENGCSMLRIKKTYIIMSSRCFHEKKNQTQNTEPEIIDCAPPENASKKQPELLN